MNKNNKTDSEEQPASDEVKISKNEYEALKAKADERDSSA